MSDLMKQLRDKQAAVEKVMAEAKDLEEKIAAVRASVNTKIGEMLLERAKTDESARVMLEEFLTDISKVRDKNIKAYAESLKTRA